MEIITHPYGDRPEQIWSSARRRRCAARPIQAQRWGAAPRLRAHFGRCPALASASQVGGQPILGVTPGATPLRHKRAAARPDWSRFSWDVRPRLPAGAGVASWA